jgi:hypothetical protein
LPDYQTILFGCCYHYPSVLLSANSNAKEKVAEESAEKPTGKHGKGKHKGSNSHKIESPKRQEPQKVACCARNMGARTQPTIPVSVVSTTKMELYKRISVGKGKQPLDRNATVSVRK